MEDLEKRFGYFLFSGIAEADSGMCSLLKRREICRRISIFLEKCTKEPFKRKKKKSDYSSFIFADEEGFYCIEPIYISRPVH